MTNESLRNGASQKDKRVSQLSRQIKDLEVDKTDLLGMLQKYESGQGSSSGNPAEKKEAPQNGVADFYAHPEINPVELGKIVVQKSSGKAARVEHIDAVYGFVVVDAGSQDGLKKDMVLNIIRNSQSVGRAVVQKVQSHVSAAVILPEWTKEEIRVGDFVSRH